MTTKKQLKQQIDNLINEVAKLREIVVSDELKKLREISKLYEEQTDLLSNIKFKIKSVKTIEETNTMVVTYQLPVINIPLNENGNPIERHPFFYSVNALGMTSMEDSDLIRNALQQAHKLAKLNKNKK